MLFLMDEHSLRVLEFYKVREEVATFASSGPGRAEAANILPSADRAQVLGYLKETEELRRYLETSRDFPIAGLKDIGTPLKKAAVEGAALRPEELGDILSVARASRLVKDALQKASGDFPLLGERSARLSSFETLEFDIARSIGGDGEVLDEASFELKKIRRGLTQIRSRINRELEQILQEHAKAVQEPVITMRGNRYVLPLKPNFRMYLQGIVHDHSTSGATVFVEPSVTVELNNKLAQLRVDEGREIERVLWVLTASVREVLEPLASSYHGLVALDVIYAKAAYALSINAHMPAVMDGGTVELKDARHPLLIKVKGGEGAVPLDVRLGREFSCLVITGPNTGGKTVVLKTIGLLCLMAQAGMLIPAAPDSAVSVFDNIYSDIGDEQSLEQNLSTFSSHMTQIVRILAGAGGGSLVLLDELGAGTDPSEGSALGVSIIEELHRRGSRVIVTTHHGALKVFAANTPGVMNASVEFDPETLSPTYRLLIGRPGRSNALLVASRLGMPEGIVEAARATRGTGEVALDSLIERLEKEQQAAREDRLRAAQESRQAREEKLRLQELLRRTEDEQRETLRKAREKAGTILSSLRYKLRELEALSRKAAPAVPEIKKKEEEIKALESGLSSEEIRVSAPKPVDLDKLVAGDSVRVHKYNKVGKVLSVKKEKKQVVVQMDAVKVTLGADELELIKNYKQGAPKAAAPITVERHEESEDEAQASEINLIGLRVEEAALLLDKYLDRCLLNGMRQVRIIHGRGTGALKKAVHEALNSHRGVKSFRHADFEQGGDAVTVAEFS
ncbi:MAG: endonuclease MutS2 [Nitrospirota bacterium]